MTQASPRMLQGLKVVDLTSVIFGPYCTLTLSDLGAEVTKIETPGGDSSRMAGQTDRNPMMGPIYMALNRGKRSVALDLKAEADRAVIHALLKDADVFIHNVRASAIERLGLGYEAVKAINPDIIYTHCVGFGSDGPYGGLQAYDDVIQTASGMTSMQSMVDGDPRPRYVPSAIADKVAGLHAAYAVLAAYIHRLKTGEGQFIEVAMFETFVHFLLQEHLFGLTFAPPTGPVGYFRQVDPDRQPFPTRDGHIAIVPYNDEAWIKLFDMTGRPDVLARPGLATPQERAANLGTLYQILATLTPQRTSAEWFTALNEASIPAAPVRDIADIQQDPHLIATEFFRRREHDAAGPYFEMRPPVRFSRPAPDDQAVPPVLGQHNDAVRHELGLAPPLSPLAAPGDAA
jgi:crotonobetainyl-CoA:carnitine CoA-transferase CaiB-like acyl-CoA transferase